MKKILSIMISVLMITSYIVVFASDNAYPTALPVVTEKVTGAVTSAITGTKLDISPANTAVTTQIATHPSFGDITAIIDGIGITYDNRRNQAYPGVNENRWTSSDSSATGTITFTFSEAQTFNTIKWSEVRKVIKKVTVKAYTESVDETPVAAAVANFSDGAETTTLFGRMAALDKTVTAKKVEFIIEDASLLATVVSIAEMEFWNDSAAVTEETVTEPYVINKETQAGDIKYLMDGRKYQEDGKTTLNWPDRWGAPKGALPTIIFHFYNNDITFDTIKYWELRKQLTGYTITCYNNGEEVYNKEFVSTDTSADATTYEMSIDMGKSITADKVCLEVTGNENLGILSFCEFEFIGIKLAPPTITDADGNDLDNQFNNSRIKNAFDGLYNNVPQGYATEHGYQFLAYKLGCLKNDGVDDFNVKVPITIQFDLGENKTFNYAELSELRCVLGEIEVHTSTDGTVWTQAGIMPKMAWSGSIETEYVHCVSFEPVTARYVKYIITEIANYDDFTDERRTANINEISVCNYDVAKTAIYPIRVYGEPLNENNTMIYTYTKDGKPEYGLHAAVNANVVIKNSGVSEKTYMILFAQYTAEDNSLVAVVSKEVTLQAGQSTIENVILNSRLNIPEVYGSSLACFVWDRVTVEPYAIAENYTQPQYNQ